MVSPEFIVLEQRDIAKNGTTQRITQLSGGPPIEGVTVTKSEDIGALRTLRITFFI